MEKSECRAWNHRDYKLCFPHHLLEMELVLSCEFVSSYPIIFKRSLLYSIFVIMPSSCSDSRHSFQHFCTKIVIFFLLYQKLNISIFVALNRLFTLQIIPLNYIISKLFISYKNFIEYYQFFIVMIILISFINFNKINKY